MNPIQQTLIDLGPDAGTLLRDPKIAELVYAALARTLVEESPELEVRVFAKAVDGGGLLLVDAKEHGPFQAGTRALSVPVPQDLKVEAPEAEGPPRAGTPHRIRAEITEHIGDSVTLKVPKASSYDIIQAAGWLRERLGEAINTLTPSMYELASAGPAPYIRDLLKGSK